uniref:Uncharacterized protein n=1 Tax=viral metagenome TaxID=1070528 RepID=A0A6M3LS65_9ZZZZ
MKFNWQKDKDGSFYKVHFVDSEEEIPDCIWADEDKNERTLCIKK